MKKILILLLIFTALLSSCRQNLQENDPLVNNRETSEPSNTGQSSQEGQTQNDPEIDPADPSAEQPLETLGPDCYGEQTHPIGQSIADLYPDQTDYQAVMTWFCNGFLFEDILTALQTADGSDFTAGDLLDKVKNGQTWDEIWAEIGFLSPWSFRTHLSTVMVGEVFR